MSQKSTVIKSFQVTNDPNELGLSLGDEVVILDTQIRKNAVWYRGFISRSKNASRTSSHRIGFFPAACVALSSPSTSADPDIPEPPVKSLPDLPSSTASNVAPPHSSPTGSVHDRLNALKMNGLCVDNDSASSPPLRPKPMRRPLILDPSPHSSTDTNTSLFSSSSAFMNIQSRRGVFEQGHPSALPSSPPPPPPISSDLPPPPPPLMDIHELSRPTSPTPSIPDRPATPPPDAILNFVLSDSLHRSPHSLSRSESAFNQLMLDITKTIDEWNGLMSMAVSEHNLDKFHQLQTQLGRLYQLRQNCTTQRKDDVAEFAEKREEIYELIEKVNSVYRHTNDSCMEPNPMPKSNNLARSYWKDSAGGPSPPLASSMAMDSSLVPRKVKDRDQSAHMNLYFDLKACVASICGSGETSELYFSIYSKSEGRFITEDYLVSLTYNGMPRDIEKIGLLNTVFVDLSKRDVLPSSSLYLVCRIVRNGKMVLCSNNTMEDPMAKSTATLFRRPFGWAVLDITSFMQSPEATEKETEFMMRIYTPANEQSFPTLYENIIRQTGGYESNTRAEMMCVALRRYDIDLEDCFKGIPRTPRLGFPDVILPGDVRNSIYVTLHHGEFSQGRKTSAKNIEVAIQVRDTTGEPLPMSVHYGTGEIATDTFESLVYYHTNSPKWEETVRLDFPMNGFDKGTHLFFTFRHCSTTDKGDKLDKAFSLAALPLMRADDTIIHDSTHTLHLFKYDKKHASPEVYIPALVYAQQVEDVDGLLNSESSLLNSIQNSKLAMSKDSIKISTKLCSTKLTQNVSLLNLLRWQSLPVSDMRTILKDFTFIGPFEITKYLEDIFGALFSILQVYEQKRQTGELVGDLPDLVFSALVFILNIVISDRRFVHFRSILEVYVKNHFGKQQDISLIWNPLLRSLLSLARNPHDPVQAKELRSAVKTWEFLFKFIVKSWHSYAALESKTAGNEFKVLCTDLFQTVTDMIMCPSRDSRRDSHTSSDRGSGLFPLVVEPATLFGTQILVLQNIHQALVELAFTPVFKADFLTNIALTCLNALPIDKKKVSDNVLQLSLRLLNGVLIMDPKSRIMIVRDVSRIVYCQLNSQNDSLAIIVLLDLFAMLADVKSHSESSFSLKRDFSSLFQFIPILARRLGTATSVEQQSELSVALISLLNILSSTELLTFVVETCEQEKSTVFLTELLNCITTWTTLRHDVDDNTSSDISGPFSVEWTRWNSSWRLVALDCISVCSTALPKVLSLCKSASSAEKVDIMKLLFTVLVKLLTMDLKEAVDEKAQVQFLARGASLISEMWKEYHSYHGEFIPALVGPFLRLTFCQECPQLASCALQLLTEMIDFDAKRRSVTSTASKSRNRRQSSNMKELVTVLTVVEIEIIDQLDRLIMNEGHGDEQYRQWLLDTLKPRLPSRESSAFFQSLEKFLTLAFSVRALDAPATSTLETELATRGTSDDDHVLLLSNLIHFTALLERTPIYVKYIHQLCDIHLRNGNYAEAAWALRLHADLYDWNLNRQVDPLDDSVPLDQLRNFLVTKHRPAKPSSSQKLKDSDVGTGGTPPPPTGLQSLLDLNDVMRMYHPQQEFTRRETLYLVIIHLHQLAQHYEHAIELAESLCHEYTRTCFDYHRASCMHLALSHLGSQLHSADRYYPGYYRVAFMGNGWKQLNSAMKYVHGKSFIYRGKAWEKLGEFVERIMAQYPDAELVRGSSVDNDPAVSEQQQSDKLLIQIATVTPEPDMNRFAEIFSAENRALVPVRLRAWYENNDTNQFVFTRPFKKSTTTKSNNNGSGGNNEFLNLWTEEYVFQTEHEFPHCLQRSEILSWTRREISPIENAIRNVEMKNRELEMLDRRFRVYVPTTDKLNGRGGGTKVAVEKRRSFATLSMGNTNSNTSSTGIPYTTPPPSPIQPHHQKHHSSPSTPSSSTTTLNNTAANNNHTNNTAYAPTTPMPNCNPLTMSINGAVDAPVNGGIPMYKHAFLHPDFLSTHPEYTGHVEELRRVIDEQVGLLRGCIWVHGRLVPAEMRPLHDSIVEFYFKNFREECERLSITSID